MKKKQKKETHLCGECANAKRVYEFHTLSVHGQQPTLADCPFMKNRRVILSELACEAHFKPV